MKPTNTAQPIEAPDLQTVFGMIADEICNHYSRPNDPLINAVSSKQAPQMFDQRT